MSVRSGIQPGAPPVSVAPEVLAAVDLGSNSFQLIVAAVSYGQLRVIDRLREMVRLAAGLDERDNLDKSSQERALACLARFGERLRDVPADRVRVVATNTLRKAHNTGAFVHRAEQALGHEIDIVSGIEEARLIYLGVSRSLPVVQGGQLVIDIGGGSTELAAGEGFKASTMESMYMGCVGLSREFFADGRLSGKRFAAARTMARLELRPVAGRFRKLAWERVAGASGTIRAAAAVLQNRGLSEGNITLDAMEQLIQDMTAFGHVDELDLPGLTAERAPVFPGGIAILVEVMRELGVRQLNVAQGAMREGILYDLAGRLGDEDSRLVTVRAMESRYQIDADQAARVELTAVSLLDQVAADWKLQQPGVRKLMGWAARLHELGLDIAHAQYHRHGAYLLEHADMPGFNRTEQRVLAALVGGHRRKFHAEHLEHIAPKGWVKRTLRMAILLRLAVLFNRSRTDEFPDLLRISASRRHITLALSSRWLQANPLTLADLEREQGYLRPSGYQLQLVVAEDD